MIVHVQGSARLLVRQASGELQHFRLSFAASNEQPYQSMARWMLEQGLTKDASWSGLRASLKTNPERAQEAFWSNPRYIFFSLTPLSNGSNMDSIGPTGAWGVSLKPMSSVAIDPLSVPLGSALWLSSAALRPALNRLVLAQDTGGAINGAVRADLFAGSGDAAGDWANQIKHPLRLWVLWPR
jgi:membrane-bound lytic murein transglycosylase A